MATPIVAIRRGQCTPADERTSARPEGPLSNVVTCESVRSSSRMPMDMSSLSRLFLGERPRHTLGRNQLGAQDSGKHKLALSTSPALNHVFLIFPTLKKKHPYTANRIDTSGFFVNTVARNPISGGHWSHVSRLDIICIFLILEFDFTAPDWPGNFLLTLSHEIHRTLPKLSYNVSDPFALSFRAI